jgi:hypothetical protein
MELNTGSSYNPTGDPLFHMPAWMRITELIAGNSHGMTAKRKTQHRPVKGVVVMSPDGVVDEFESIDSAAATYGLSRTGIYHRIVRRNIDKDGTWLEYA